MSQPPATMDLRRPADGVGVVDIRGDFTGDAEAALMDAYARACAGGARALVLNFGDLAYMNSSGIGLLVTLLIRVDRRQQRLLACGMSEHYRHIFALTQLDGAIGVFDTEAAALAAAGAP
ncbi:MAG TPA: STAS domain-containing protein [Thermomicrobiales bacterium]|nr:STAS domain-containing protein [Thermomicrobiales bacterium]